MKKIILLSILLIFLITGTGFAFPNEPDGFRGLKWGDKPTEDMILIGTLPVEGNIYRRDNDKLYIGSTELGNIYYIFNLYSKQFYKVKATFNGEYDHNILKMVFEDNYGKATWKAEDGDLLQWMGETTSSKAKIYLQYNRAKRNGYFLIVSEEIQRESPEDNKQKELEKAKNDF